MNLSLLLFVLSILLVMASASSSSKWALKLLVFYMLFCSILAVIILGLFLCLSKKSGIDSLITSVFECGFTSYYFSRFSFSVHYFTVGLIFLFLDLELCYLLPFFNSSFSELKFLSLIWIFIVILVLGLLEEWKHGMLDWKI